VSLRNLWWMFVDKTWYEAKFRLERRGVFLCTVWCWPQITYRFNSSLMWGAAPYKEWAFGPVRYRRYQ
jgi:hypothetical protein